MRNPAQLRAIDLFAGLGGFTEAAARAGVRVVWAANHWRDAVDIHAANHPDVEHSCQDLHQADWECVPKHEILLASPCCQGHAKARGKERPHHDLSRSTAWAVVSCAEYHSPQLIVVENVPEFLNWSLLPAWKMAMAKLGYSLSVNTFDAADAGTPQNRVRTFIVGNKGDAAIQIAPPAVAHLAAKTIIDFKAGNWSPVHKRGRAANTITRFEHGRANFGGRFIFSYYGNTRTSRSIDRPIGTITTRDRWAVVDGDRMRMLRVPEALRAMGFSDGYIVPENGRLAMHMIGNAVPPDLAAHVIQQAINATGGCHA